MDLTPVEPTAGTGVSNVPRVVTSAAPAERGEAAIEPPPVVAIPAGWTDQATHAAYERLVHLLVAYRRSVGRKGLVFAGAVRREGASTIARNVCRALVQNAHDRVILIDGNLRTPEQHEAFGVDRSPGLTDVVEDDLPIAAAVRQVGDTGLSLLTAGRPVDNPSQVVARELLARTIMTLEGDVDWVVIDGPAFTMYPDGALLAGVTGGAVLVVEAESTRSEVADEAKRVVEATGARVVGAVLNRRRYHIPGFLYRRL
jgi:Mrp family chromosome partitioning ATPase